MKKIQIAALLALAGAGLLAPQLQAATTTYSSNGDDLFLGFNQDNNSAADILIDLGQASQFRDATVQGSLNSIIGTGLGSLLSTNFGAGWSTDPTVHWGIVGYSGSTAQTVNGIPEVNNTLYISNPETNLTAPTSNTNAVQAGAGNAILTMKNQWVGLTTSTGLNNGVVETPSATSWAGEAGSAFGDATQFGQFEDAPPSVTSMLDLYRLTRSSSTSAADGLKGTFHIDSTGQVFYTTVPEPTAISLLGGTGMLLLLARRRRTTAVA